MADSQKERIKQWERKQKIFKTELEGFKAALDIYKEERSVIAIQYYLEDIEKEFLTFTETQYELDDIEHSQIMQEHIKLKQEFYNCKEKALYLVNKEYRQIKQPLKKKKPRFNSGWGLHDTWGIMEPSETISNTAKAVDEHLESLFNVAPLQRTSYEDLQSYATKIKTHYNALKAFEQPTRETILLHLFASKLDHETRINWKFMTKYASFLQVDELIEFLFHRRTSLEYLESVETNPIESVYAPFCPFCNEKHKIWKCRVFQQKSIRERVIAVFELSVCTNCLIRGHVVQNCTAVSLCDVCGKRHHTLLHRSDI
jgi:hypothetical protein